MSKPPALRPRHGIRSYWYDRPRRTYCGLGYYIRNFNFASKDENVTCKNCKRVMKARA